MIVNYILFFIAFVILYNMNWSLIGSYLDTSVNVIPSNTSMILSVVALIELTITAYYMPWTLNFIFNFFRYYIPKLTNNIIY